MYAMLKQSLYESIALTIQLLRGGDLFDDFEIKKIAASSCL